MNVQAVYRLAVMRERFPDLHQAEATARHDLAGAIMDWDEVQEQDPASSIPQGVKVEQALAAYGQALANLLRGEEG